MKLHTLPFFSAFLLVFATIFFVSCGGSDESPISQPDEYVRSDNQPEFTLPKRFDSTNSATFRVDMNRDGFDDALVLTYMEDRENNTPYARFNRYDVVDTSDNKEIQNPEHVPAGHMEVKLPNDSIDDVPAEDVLTREEKISLKYPLHKFLITPLQFDSLIIMEYDSVKKDFSATDYFEFSYGVSIDIVDVNQDLQEDILIETATGGSSYLQNGLAIIGYDRATDSYKYLLEATGGNPTLMKKAVNGGEEAFCVTMEAQYWATDLAHFETVLFTDRLIPLKQQTTRDDSLVLETELSAEHFSALLDYAQLDYSKYKSLAVNLGDEHTAEEQLELYAASISVIQYAHKRSDTEILQTIKNDVDTVLPSVLPDSYILALRDFLQEKGVETTTEE